MFWRKVASRSTPLLLLALLVACKEQPAPSADILIKIDNHSITLQEFRRDFERTLAAGEQPQTAERDALQRAFIAQTIDRQLAIAEAKRLGIEVTETEVDTALAEHRRDYPTGKFEENLREKQITLDEWKRDLKERLLMEKVANKIAGEQVKVSDTEIADYYRANREEFDRPAQVRARQIVVASEAEGEKVLALLKAKQPFAEIAKAHSLSPDAEQGGDLGFFGRGEMPAEFDAVVFNLPLGQLSPLIKSEYGYHIFLVEERREAGKHSLEQARDEIRGRLRAEKEEHLYREWLDRLRDQAKIDVNWTLLDKH